MIVRMEVEVQQDIFLEMWHGMLTIHRTKQHNSNRLIIRVTRIGLEIRNGHFRSDNNEILWLIDLPNILLNKSIKYITIHNQSPLRLV